MPHLRRQPNPHDLLANQGPNAPGSLRAQFQTPPSRNAPSHPSHRHPPSTGPHEITPEAVPAMAPPTGYPNPFAIFGRARHAQPPPEDDEELDADYDPNAQGVGQLEYEDGMGVDDQLGFDDGIEDSEELEGEEVEEVMEDQMEDADEEMFDRGMRFYPRTARLLRLLPMLSTYTYQQRDPRLRSRPTYVKSPRSRPGLSRPPNRAAASPRSVTLRLHNTGSQTARSHIH